MVSTVLTICSLVVQICFVIFVGLREFNPDSVWFLLTWCLASLGLFPGCIATGGV